MGYPQFPLECGSPFKAKWCLGGLLIQRGNAHTCSSKLLSAVWQPKDICGSAVGPTGVCVWAEDFQNKEKAIFQTYNRVADLQEVYRWGEVAGSKKMQQNKKQTSRARKAQNKPRHGQEKESHNEPNRKSEE